MNPWLTKGKHEHSEKLQDLKCQGKGTSPPSSQNKMSALYGRLFQPFSSMTSYTLEVRRQKTTTKTLHYQHFPEFPAASMSTCAPASDEQIHNDSDKNKDVQAGRLFRKYSGRGPCFSAAPSVDTPGFSQSIRRVGSFG